MERATMTEREFCQAVNISRVTAWRLREAGKLPYYKLGTRVLYGQRHVEEFLSRFERGGNQQHESNNNQGVKTDE